jgi:peptidoglycan/xylan/chitin deacetylase (PgdA/CDA1 family)
MRVITLLYHDIVSEGEPESSGFPSPSAASYKLYVSAFSEHIQAIAYTVKDKPLTVMDLLDRPALSNGFLLTFDDGGVSAYLHTADILESRRWFGHFLITTDYIGTPTFLSRSQIKELHERGHFIGSHSCSHPARMTRLTQRDIVEEWRRSINLLSDVIGQPVIVASVPSGFYSKRVAAAAAEAGIKALFTSEPVTKCRYVDGCFVFGRYIIRKRTPPETAAAIASGRLIPRLKQRIVWDAKKIAKAASGRLYEKSRDLLFRVRSGR